MDVFDVILPVRCALCGEHGAHVCARCYERMQAAPLVHRAARGDTPQVASLGPYTGSLRRAVLGLKFRNRRAAAFALGALLGRKMHRDVDAIVPVPLHQQRLLSRGFNQADTIAQGLTAAMAVSRYPKALIRLRPTSAQSSLSLSQRNVNVSGAFCPGPDVTHLRGQRVMIVDDVVTTGATVAACASALQEGGIREIVVAALAIRL